MTVEEIVARAIAKAHGNDPDEWWESWQTCARAAILAMADNVTDEMVGAAFDHALYKVRPNKIEWEWVKAAIAAALRSATREG